MRVLIVNEYLELGGAETMAVELANGLALLDGIEVFFTAAEGALRERLVSQVKYHPIPKFSFSKLIAVGCEIKKIILEVKPDVIHSQGATVGVLAGFITRRVNKNIKIVITHHSKRFSRLPVPVSIFLFKKYCDFFIAISRDKFQSLIKGGIPQERVALTPNFIDFGRIKDAVVGLKREDVLSDMGIDFDSKVISMTGRLMPAKRFDRFIRILAECAQRTDRKVVGLIMGDGPERQKLESLAISLNQKNLKIVFLGYQKNVFKYLCASDIFLFPSEHPEVLPMCLIEASAIGVPIVCSNVPGNSDIVKNEVNGLLIDLESDYVESVFKILNNQEFAIKLASNGIERAKRLFDKQVVLKKILDVYNSQSTP